MRIDRREFLCALSAMPALGIEAPTSKLVYTARDRLVYTPDERGNRIPDFSACGYRGGGVGLPDVAMRAELSPAAGDATARIQDALEGLAREKPDAQGFRGALLLRKGH